MKDFPEGKYAWTVTVGEKGIAIPPKAAFAEISRFVFGDDQ